MKRKSVAPILLGLIVFTFLEACAGPPNLIGVQQKSEEASSEGAFTEHRVLLATTRRRSDNPAELFSGQRAVGTSYALLDVSVPPVHQTGKIEQSKGGSPDPRKDFTIAPPIMVPNEQQFLSTLNAELRKRPPNDRTVMIFVHGYNTNLSAALLRIAQFVEDTDYAGVPVLFSWPSGANALKYVYDLNSAIHARDALVDIADLADRSVAQQFDVVAHSMGNMLVMEGIRQIALTRGLRIQKSRYIILASPDIDADVFAKQVMAVPREQRQFYVLVSDDDAALRLSRKVAGGVPRVGAADADRLAEIGVAVIDLSQIDDGRSIHHSKFADAPEVVQIIGKNFAMGNTLSAEKSRFGSAIIVQPGGLTLGIP
ncbi:alpha/beta hydrolase [Aliiruegeria sabulilitoris]|uniref:alpha/beta hydrolase n=1 Tax=Aliiruegeria sabulilitoris TaxID=1510458 RepID=UPI0008314D55|nr:alpha/beta hydrolase [Aliiruegeria sabulilitoris]NDR57915.1 alpha/beta hydrolase [Pseudoruegeria sp. M32A2M]